MTTLTRWWAPDSPGIGPDENDLAMLVPGGDGPKDLGQALLVLHRVGAAACEAVATQPLADESILGLALASARAMVVPEAVTMVSKAVDDASYAGLLLKDTLDDAEAAALSLWRSCTAKDMPPSMVAKRVGAVYGVPIRELGKYTAAAMDPKTRPEVLEHLADRALFDFIAKTVTEEAVETKVEISKAPVAEEPRPRGPRVGNMDLQELLDRSQRQQVSEYLDEHNVEQDERGRFVREGASRSASLRAKPMRARSLRAKPLRGAPQNVAQRKSALKLNTVREAQRKTLTVQQARLKELIAEDTSEALEQAMNVQIGLPRPAPDMLKRIPDRNTGYVNLWASLSFVLPADEWEAAKEQMGSDEEGTLYLRVGNLAEYTGEHPELTDSQEANNLIAYAAQMVAARPEHAGQRHVKRVTDASHKLTDRRQLEELKLEFLKELEKQGLLRNPTFELNYVTSAQADDDPDDLVLMWVPPQPGKHPGRRPVPIVVETVLEEDAVRGTDHAHDNKDVRVDPNLPLRAYVHTSPMDRRYVQTDPNEPGVIVVRAYLSAAQEEDIDQAVKRRARRKRPFGKGAAEQERFRELVAARRIQRDPQSGEFVDIQELLDRSTAQQAKAKPLRAQSMRAKPLRGRALAGQAMGKPVAAKPAQVKQAKMKPLNAKQVSYVATVAAEHQDARQTVFLDDAYDYTVLDMHDLGGLLDESNSDFLEQTYERPTELGLSAQHKIRQLARSKVVGPHQARMELVGEAENMLAVGPGLSQWSAPVVTARVFNEDDLDAVAYELEDYLAKNEGVMRLHVLIQVDEDHGGYELKIRGNASPVDQVHLVRWEDSVGQRLELLPEGSRRLLDRNGMASWLKMRFARVTGPFAGQPGDSDVLPNPVVFTYAAVRPQR